jgi:hypothetical protein
VAAYKVLLDPGAIQVREGATTTTTSSWQDPGICLGHGATLCMDGPLWFHTNR